METFVEHEDLIQPCLQKGKETTTIQRQTRGSLNSTSMKQAHQECGRDGSHTRGVYRKKAIAKESVTIHGKKKVKPMSPTIVDTVFGNLKSCVLDVDEFCWKRDEDTLKCGRMTRIIGKTSSTTSICDEIKIDFEDRVPLKDTIHDSSHKCTKCNDNSICNQLLIGLSLSLRSIQFSFCLGRIEIENRRSITCILEALGMHGGLW